MRRTKIISIALISLILCGVCLLVAGCPESQNEKNDVSMKIACCEVIDGQRVPPYLEEWLFTPDVSEKHIEIKYDGKQRAFFLSARETKNNLSANDCWKTVNGEVHSSLWKIGESQENIYEYIVDKGSYCLVIYACHYGTYEQWNSRTLRLYIDII